ncbi:MAG: adenylosuccinate lyase family protein [Betaproteobacteria bacterium]|nr:adenylosuccinate lyase family protein [Betaproteobacteria bacterium]MBU6511964.1 adenylosuccinate lyase family protein [Betaproteobacteria bacterium]MDE2152194.1 adenylosuccinate lyase family protein [Betaproteobacteria bacterium]MDE2479771.1 adenylosuccinate lyase family protein [Betaproteobacteria bacterium]
MSHASRVRPSPSEISDLFAQRSQWQAWLDVEAALARTQAELGMIPAAAAEEIARKASFGHVDEAALAQDIARTRAPVVSLVRALAQACEGEAGGFVHWGATTQNVMQTARAVLMRRSHEAFMGVFADVLERLAGMAEAGAEMLAVGRTNFRQGLPITFGWKAAAWIEEMLRHRSRFEGARERVFAAQWGGALGAMHASGELGPELNRRLAARLGLGCMEVPSRAGLDYLAEYFLLLGLFSASCSKIARELYTLMADEIGEVYEQQGEEVVGSSTMPNKVNPKSAALALSLAARVRSCVPLALEAMQPTHEGDGANNQMLHALIDQTCPLAYQMICAFDELLECLRLVPEAMRRNVAISGQAMAAENAMMALAPALGRTRAYACVKHAIHEAGDGSAGLAEALLREPEVRDAIDEFALRHALDPASYTGRSREMSLAMARTAREAAKRLREAPCAA